MKNNVALAETKADLVPHVLSDTQFWSHFVPQQNEEEEDGSGEPPYLYGPIRLGWWRIDDGSVPLAVAVKSKTLQERVAHEKQIYLRLGLHPRITPLLAVLHSSLLGPAHETSLVLARSHPSGRTLECVRLEPGLLSWSERIDILLHVNEALVHCHSRHVIHHDVSPNNVLLHRNPSSMQWEGWLTDFEYSDLMDSTTSTARRTFGTPGFHAPEQSAKSPLTQITVMIDVYAYGALCLHVLGDRPNRLASQLTLALNPKISRLAQVIESSMSREPTERASLHSLAKRLRETRDSPPVTLFDWMRLAIVFLLKPSHLLWRFFVELVR